MIVINRPTLIELFSRVVLRGQRDSGNRAINFVLLVPNVASADDFAILSLSYPQHRGRGNAQRKLVRNEYG